MNLLRTIKIREKKREMSKSKTERYGEGDTVNLGTEAARKSESKK